VALRSRTWRIHALPPRIKTPDTAGGRNARHYQSSEHQRWALAVKRRDGFTCQNCGAIDVRLVADHIIEIDDGGAHLDVNNGMTLCVPCHNRKTAQAAQARRGRVKTRSARGT
jgi:5-methylcytosine-specific restriction enzyme A